MKYYKKIFIIVLCLLTMFTVYKIVKTYSLFESNISSTKNIDVSAWNITVNNQDIVSGVSHDFNITSDYIFIPRNVNVVSGKIAPGSRGAFSISIEPEDTQVSIRYDIEIDESQIESIPFTIYDVSSRDVEIIKTGEYTYTGVILLRDIEENYSQTISFSFLWTNREECNDNDTAVGTIYNNSINIPVSISFKQYLGENIIPYNPGEQPK